jgi:hypothetical protein
MRELTPEPSRGIEPGRVEPLDLEQALTVDLVQSQTRHWLDVIEDAQP